MCLYGFIPVFGGSYLTIHHPPPCPDSSPPWQPLSLTTPFTEHYILIYGLVFFPADHSALRVMVYLRFSEPLKEGWAAEPLAMPPAPSNCCGPSLGYLLYFSSASSVIFLYDVSVCSSLFPLSFPSVLAALLLHLYPAGHPLEGHPPPFKKQAFLPTPLIITDPI